LTVPKVGDFSDGILSPNEPVDALHQGAREWFELSQHKWAGETPDSGTGDHEPQISGSVSDREPSPQVLVSPRSNRAGDVFFR
jgi:hypothetical protein